MYLEGVQLLPLNQSAYRVNYSTETAILRVFSDLVADSNAGNISLMALLDSSASFDTFNYDHHTVFLIAWYCRLGAVMDPVLPV